MDFEKARADFKKVQEKISAINHVTELMFIDAETIAPAGAASNRSKTLEVLNDELFNARFGEKTVEIMETLLENKDKLDIVESRSLEVLKREIDRMKSVPKDEYIRYKSLLNSAQDAWHTANEENDFDILCPYLEKVFDKVREFAANHNPDMNPYDYCLDTHDPGSNTQVYDRIFDGVRSEITPLLQQVMSKPPVDDSCLKGDYSAEKQKALALYIMELLGINMNNVGLATSEHPFISRLGSHYDVRLTTKYSRSDFTFSLFTILFGCGYVLAETGQGEEVAYTLADGSASFGMMEAQTRFYENIIGRSRAFIDCIHPQLKTLFPNSMKASSEEIYLAVNKVSAGPIRMGSDELTNNLHVLVRYELEKALINKELPFKDLPEAWAKKYKDYLGVEVKDHAHGVLQDILWADAAIGYFPTAVLGNSYSALVLEKMKEDIDVEGCIRSGNFSSINEWNREHIWKYFGLYDSNTIMEKYVGIPVINSDAYVKYLKNKYTEIYKL